MTELLFALFGASVGYFISQIVFESQFNFAAKRLAEVCDKISAEKEEYRDKYWTEVNVNRHTNRLLQERADGLEKEVEELEAFIEKKRLGNRVLGQ